MDEQQLDAASSCFHAAFWFMQIDKHVGRSKQGTINNRASKFRFLLSKIFTGIPSGLSDKAWLFSTSYPIISGGEQEECRTKHFSKMLTTWTL